MIVQIAQFIRESQTYLFKFQHRDKEILEENENVFVESSEDSHQQLIDVHKKQVKRKEDFFMMNFVQILCNAETIGTLEQEKDHWRLEYQLLKIKFEKMRDDHSKQIEELKDKTNHTEQIDEIISSSPMTVIILTSSIKKRSQIHSFRMINEIIEQVQIHRVNVKC